MTTEIKNVDRSTDLSQPVEQLGPDETIKLNSNYLRGSINESLLDGITDGVPFVDNKLMKFHGIYQQDDRDIRDERRRQKLEPDYRFMIRVRMAGGICTPDQWLKLDDLARQYGNDQLRLTTRQTLQFHWVLKKDVRAAIQGLSEALLDTIAACGDDARGVMSTANPGESPLHAEVAELARSLSNHVIPKTRAYHEIWYGEERVATSEPEEPFYGPTYLPRKFKIGFAIPPHNDVDIYTQDLGFVAITGDDGALEGFNVIVGGGMGRSDQDANTFARLADVLGYILKDDLIAVTDAVMGVQRDYGNRKDRPRARFKYTVADKGLDFVRAEVKRRMGAPLAGAKPFAFTHNGDALGWHDRTDGHANYGCFIENGRLAGQQFDGLRAIARVHRGQFVLTPNQNIIVADIAPEDRDPIAALLAEYGLDAETRSSALRLNSMACVALPTCPLAMAEAERYLPDLVGKVDAILADVGLEKDAITMRMTGCPNGCARPYVAEIALTGRARGKYNLFLGGGFTGDRLATLTHENIGEDAILGVLDPLLRGYARDREPGERFGDYLHRSGAIGQ